MDGFKPSCDAWYTVFVSMVLAWDGSSGVVEEAEGGGGQLWLKCIK